MEESDQAINVEKKRQNPEPYIDKILEKTKYRDEKVLRLPLLWRTLSSEKHQK
jgi:hypothetical protein